MVTSVFFRRFIAFVVDCALLFVVLAPLGMLVQSLLGVVPETARQIYVTLLLNFSLPAWAYFTLADYLPGGATLGKKWLKIRTCTEDQQHMTMGRALGRTALKMLPWETTHAAAFLFVRELGVFELINWIGIMITYVLVFVFLIVAWRSQGEHSVHDLAIGTRVTLIEPLIPNIKSQGIS